MSHFFAPLPLGEFDFVQIDYPWPWETYSDKGRKKTPNYDTMTWDQIVSTRPQDLLTKNGAALFWCTWPLIARQSLIIENCFGLEIKTGGAWSKRTVNGKLRWGPGHIIRTVCEPFLIVCKKGHKLRGRSVKNLVETFDQHELRGVARENSRKPEEVYELIEMLTPGFRRADVFSRQPRAGWQTWGKERLKFNSRAGNGVRR